MLQRLFDVTVVWPVPVGGTRFTRSTPAIGGTWRSLAPIEPSSSQIPSGIGDRL
jgi:hypothetical protein